MPKSRFDAPGLAVMLAIQGLLAFSQIVVKLAASGFSPLFFAGARSALAVVFVLAWLIWRGKPFGNWRAELGPGLLIGLSFSVEFIGVFIALDRTSVGHASLLFYSMPLWFAGLAHWLLPGNRMTTGKALGLILAFVGCGVAILSRDTPGSGVTLTGDLFAVLGALGWTATAFIARGTSLVRVDPGVQLLWMLAVSAPVLLIAAPFMEPLLRDPQPIDWFWLLFQAVVVSTGGYIVWLWLLAEYPAAVVASFSFLTPVMAILMGHFIFGELLSPSLIAAAALVSCGIVLINRRA